MLTSLVGSVATGAGPGAGAKNVGGAPPSPTASVEATGTLAVSPDQDGIVTGGYTLILTTTNCTWVPTIAADNSFTTGLLAGITSAQVEAAGYDAIKGTYLTFSNVARTSDNIVTITLPAFTAYAVTASETLTIVVPADNVEYSDGALTAVLNPVIANVAEAVTLSGTCTSSGTEGSLVAGSLTTILTLAGDLYVADDGTFAATRAAILAGFSSDNATDATDFVAEVAAKEGVGSVVRTSAQVVTITWSAAAALDITVLETVTHTMPAAVLLASSGTIVASPTFTVTPTTVVLTGTALDSIGEADVVTGNTTIIFTVTGDTWAATLGDSNQITTDFLAAIDSAQAEAAGWDAEVRDNLVFGDLVRDNATQCTLTLGAEASYDITANETITASPPASSLLASPTAIVATPTFTVSGDLIANAYLATTFDLSEQVQNGGTGATGFSGDGLGNWGGWVVEMPTKPGTPDPDNGADLITTAANHSAGLGGRGYRHMVGDGVNNNGGGFNLLFNGGASYLTEFWVRWYMRYETGFAWVGGSGGNAEMPYYEKIIRVYNTALNDYSTVIGWYFNPSPDSTWGRLHIAPHQAAYNASLGWDDVYPTKTADGTWFCCEAYMKVNTVIGGVGQSDGAMATWLNGVPCGRNDAWNFTATDNGALGWSGLYLGSNRSEANFYNTIMAEDFDDIVIYNTTPPNLDANGKAMIGPTDWVNP